ncbi:MAG: hypothetical protein HC796_02105 [Synechococcaceae cyanobacterium RL_1_2]|nr:hypothetical protein [Synechococcaceae cyanobacterium RL_1_2]
MVMIGHSLGGYTALALAGAELDVNQVKRFCDRSLMVNRSPADWLQCEAAKLPPKNYNFKDGRVKQLMVLNRSPEIYSPKPALATS